MRYKQYLIHEGRSKEITQDQAFEIIYRKCDQAWQAYQNNKIFFRGLNKAGEYLFIDPKSGKPRKSANSDNYYTLLVDNSPLWKKYPKRSESIIGTSSYRYATNYGEVYEVFPYDNSKIGVAPQNDFWFSFSNGLGSGNSLNFLNFKLKKLFNQYDVTIKDNNFNDFKKSLDRLDVELRNDIDNLSILDIVTKTWRIKSESFIDNLNRILDPKPNHFEVVTNMNDIPHKGNERELWTDAKCVMIKSALGAGGGLNPHLEQYMEKGL